MDDLTNSLTRPGRRSSQPRNFQILGLFTIEAQVELCPPLDGDNWGGRNGQDGDEGEDEDEGSIGRCPNLSFCRK